jgi:N-acetylmuramoyl-L-alanine amidase
MTQIIHPGIPGTNFWHKDRKDALKMAHQYADEMRLNGYNIVDNEPHAPGQLPHLHVEGLDGVRLPAHFYYGRRRPRKAPRSWSRKYIRRAVDEADPFLDSIWGWFSSEPAAVAIVPRTGWGAKAPKCTQTLKVPVRYLFIHHTAGNAPTTESGEQSAMRGTQAYHQNNKGWCDIAYNFLIMPSGRVYEGRGWNRVNGATKGYNSNSLAFCWAGNYDTSPPSQASIDAGRALVAQAMRDGYLTASFTMRGHRDVASTACPGRYLYARLRDLDSR